MTVVRVLATEKAIVLILISSRFVLHNETKSSFFHRTNAFIYIKAATSKNYFLRPRQKVSCISFFAFISYLLNLIRLYKLIFYVDNVNHTYELY